jgi:hypothetical protein
MYIVFETFLTLMVFLEHSKYLPKAMMNHWLVEKKMKFFQTNLRYILMLLFCFSSSTAQPEIENVSVIFCFANRTDSDGDAGVKSI